MKKNTKAKSGTLQFQSGVGLVEVLVAVIIFAFGMLAIAGLQLAALKYQKGAWSRAGSATLVTDLSERMRSNIVAARAGNYQIIGSYVSLSGNAPSPSSCDPANQVCSSADIAANDLAEWFSSVSKTLPGGVGMITGSVTNGFITTVMWIDKNAVDVNGTLVSSNVCPNAAQPTANCCPAGTPPGIRCVNSIVLP